MNDVKQKKELVADGGVLSKAAILSQIPHPFILTSRSTSTASFSLV